MKGFYIILGIVLIIISLVLVPNYFPANLPLAIIGGSLVGWNMSEI